MSWLCGTWPRGSPCQGSGSSTRLRFPDVQGIEGGCVSGTLTGRYRWVSPEQHVGRVLVLGVQPPRQEGFTGARPLRAGFELAWCPALGVGSSWSLSRTHRLLQPCPIRGSEEGGGAPMLGPHNSLSPGAPVLVQLIHASFFPLPLLFVDQSEGVWN